MLTSFLLQHQGLSTVSSLVKSEAHFQVKFIGKQFEDSLLYVEWKKDMALTIPQQSLSFLA